MTDQAPRSLFEYHGGLRKMVMREGVAALLLQALGSGFDDRIVGRGKGQFVDDHQLQSVAGNIDAFPERRRGHQDASRLDSSVIALPETFNQPPFGRFALHQDFQLAVMTKAFAQLIADQSQVAERGC